MTADGLYYYGVWSNIGTGLQVRYVETKSPVGDVFIYICRYCSTTVLCLDNDTPSFAPFKVGLDLRGYREEWCEFRKCEHGKRLPLLWIPCLASIHLIQLP